MNALESCTITSPYEKSEECAKFTIDDGSYVFSLSGVMVVGREYTFSCWVKSEADGYLFVHDATFSSTTEWSYCSHTFTATGTDLDIAFTTAGTYYVYHTQLEIGNKATDWTPAVEDVNEGIFNAQSSADNASSRVTAAESLIQQLSDQILMVVSDENGRTMLEQTSTGWSFSLGGLQDSITDTQNGLADLQSDIGDTNHTVEILQQAVNDLAETSEYIRIQVYEDEPCIELGESDSDFKLLITNTRIMFMEGSSIPTYIDTDGVNTENITVNKELRQTYTEDATVKGHYVWVVRQNGNYGLQWKGVTS